MKFDKVEITGGMVLFAAIAGMIAAMAGHVASESWSASEKASAYKAYTECLREMHGQPIDVLQTFCGKIKDQL